MSDELGSNPQAELHRLATDRLKKRELAQQAVLDRLEAVNKELWESTKTFEARLKQVLLAMGDPLPLYRTQLSALQGFCSRFAEFVPAAAEFAGNGFPALRDRLAFLLSDTEGACIALHEMCVTRAAGNATIEEIWQDAGTEMLQASQNINTAWRRAFGAERTS
jgi:hypothetical protein